MLPSLLLHLICYHTVTEVPRHFFIVTIGISRRPGTCYNEGNTSKLLYAAKLKQYYESKFYRGKSMYTNAFSITVTRRCDRVHETNNSTILRTTISTCHKSKVKSLLLNNHMMTRTDSTVTLTVVDKRSSISISLDRNPKTLLFFRDFFSNQYVNQTS